MTSSPLRALGISLLPALSALTLVSPASAQECGDVTCDVGFTCNVYDYGDDPLYSCDRAECESDADCGDYMVCGTFETYCDEARIACAEGEDCEAVETEPCEPGEYKQCTAAWELPCEADADCGDGFQCESYEVCDCPELAPDEEVPPEGLVCDICHQSEDKWCNQEQIECAEDADCPTDWTCVETWAGTCDAEGVCTDEMALMCQPPYDKVYGPSSGGGGILEASASDGAVATLGTEAEVERAEDDVAAEAVDDLAESDEQAAEDAEIVEDEGASDPEIVEDEGASEEEVDDVKRRMPAGDEPSASSGGCAIAQGPVQSTGLTWLALGLGALLVGRRRRNG